MKEANIIEAFGDRPRGEKDVNESSRAAAASYTALKKIKIHLLLSDDESLEPIVALLSQRERDLKRPEWETRARESRLLRRARDRCQGEGERVLVSPGWSRDSVRGLIGDVP